MGFRIRQQLRRLRPLAVLAAILFVIHLFLNIAVLQADALGLVLPTASPEAALLEESPGPVVTPTAAPEIPAQLVPELSAGVLPSDGTPQPQTPSPSAAPTDPPAVTATAEPTTAPTASAVPSPSPCVSPNPEENSTEAGEKAEQLEVAPTPTSQPPGFSATEYAASPSATPEPLNVQNVQIYIRHAGEDNFVAYTGEAPVKANEQLRVEIQFDYTFTPASDPTPVLEYTLPQQLLFSEQSGITSGTLIDNFLGFRVGSYELDSSTSRITVYLDNSGLYAGVSSSISFNVAWAATDSSHVKDIVWTDSFSQPILVDDSNIVVPISKKQVSISGTTLHFEIRLDKTQNEKFASMADFTVLDTMENFKLLDDQPDSVRIFGRMSTTESTQPILLEKDSDYTITYEAIDEAAAAAEGRASQHLLTIHVLEAANEYEVYYIQYAATYTGVKATATNAATIVNSEIAQTTETITTYNPDNSGSSSASTVRCLLKVTKFDSTTINDLVNRPLALDGADFQCSYYWNGSWYSVVNENNSDPTFTTGNVSYDKDNLPTTIQGSFQLPAGKLFLRTLYKLEETAAPAGYTALSDPIYFYFTRVPSASPEGSVSTLPSYMPDDVLPNMCTVIYADTELKNLEVANRPRTSLVVTKVNSLDEAVAEPLSGCGFSLFSDPECTTLATAYWDFACTELITDDTAHRTDDFGQLTFYGLSPGTYYIKETYAPTGYLLKEPQCVEIGEGERDYTLVPSTEYDAANNDSFYVPYILRYPVTFNGIPQADVTDDHPAIHIRIVDKAIYVMPSTGGNGILPYTITGILLLSVSCCILYTRKRRFFAPDIPLRK